MICGGIYPTQINKSSAILAFPSYYSLKVEVQLKSHANPYPSFCVTELLSGNWPAIACIITRFLWEWSKPQKNVINLDETWVSNQVEVTSEMSLLLSIYCLTLMCPHHPLNFIYPDGTKVEALKGCRLNSTEKLKHYAHLHCCLTLNQCDLCLFLSTGINYIP